MAEQWFSTFRTIALVLSNLMLFKYFAFLIIAPFYQLLEVFRLRKLQLSKINEYKVSVIIPAWNEEVGVLKTIKSVLDNTYDNVEIVVVNDGSTDNTSKEIRKFIKSVASNKSNKHWKKKKITFVDNKVNGGKGNALNTGIKKSIGEIVLTIDADSILEKHAIENLINYYQDEKIDGVVGNVSVANSNSIVAITQKLEYLFGFYFKRSHAVMGAEYIFGGACASFRRTVFEKIGYYDEKNKTEDIEMTMRFRFNGYNCNYAEDVICYTEGASEVDGLIKQRERWKKGRMDTFIKYRSMFFSKDKRHNKFLTFFVLPFSLLAEFQLLVEPISIALLVTYSFIALDFLSLAFGILFTFVLYCVNGLFNGKRIHWKLILLFPFTWPLFYFLIWIEFIALIGSISMVLRGEDIVWQNWKRTGI
jgi:cellulose synthase/poly-beta-1,6-N-acetylglucosamine synthase-like glycosyltransferase